MKVSVIIPLYNKEKTIERAVNSVISQTYNNWELIIVNDGSTDMSADLIKRYNDTRIRVYYQENSGASAARNIGVDIATGDWVSFLDADDEYDPNFIFRCVEILYENKEKNITFISSNFKRKPLSGKASISAFDKKLDTSKLNYFNLCKGTRTPANSSSTIVNKVAFYEVGGFPENVKYFEDWILWMKLAWHGNYIFISEPLSFYYENTNGISFIKNINIEEFFKCAMKLINTAHDGVSKNKIQNKELMKDTITYINSFIICECRFLARCEKHYLAFRLMLNLNLRYLNSYILTEMIRTFAIIANSCIVKFSNAFRLKMTV